MNLYSNLSPNFFRVLILFVFCFGISLTSNSQVKSAPYSETFNSSIWLSQDINTNVSSVPMPLGWNQSPTGPGSDNWIAYYGRQNNRGPYGGHPNFTDNYIAFTFNNRNNPQPERSFISPSIDISNLLQPQFQFYYHITGDKVPDFKVEIDDGSGYQQVFFVNSQTHSSQWDPYTKFSLDLSSFGNIIKVKFSASSSTSADAIIALDDISFTEPIVCPDIDSLSSSLVTDSTFQLSWSSVSGAQDYFVYSIPVNPNLLNLVTPSSIHIMDTITSNSSIFRLPTDSICYHYYVRANCGGVDFSSIKGPLKICNLDCPSENTPYYIQLNSWPKPCWNPSSNGFITSNLLKTKRGNSYITSHLDTSYLISPFIKMDSNTNYLKLNWSKDQNPTSLDSLFIYGRPIGTNAWIKIIQLGGPAFWDSNKVWSISEGMELKTLLDPATFSGKTCEFKILYQKQPSIFTRIFIRDFYVGPDINSDLELISSQLFKSALCTGNDSLQVRIRNNSNSLVDLQLHPLQVSHKISGPEDQEGFGIISHGTIAPGDTLEAFVDGPNLTASGVYQLQSTSIELNPINQNPSNDRFEIVGDNFLVESSLWVSPETMVIVTDTSSTVNIIAKSKLFSNKEIIITEVCHNKATLGAPANGWPNYLDADDYIEISGKANYDFSGYRITIWRPNSSSSIFFYTFPPNSVLSPNGTAIIGFGTNLVASPSNFYYLIPSFSFNTLSVSPQGYTLHDQNLDLVDAVGYSGSNSEIPFPASSFIVPNHWKGTFPSLQGTSGIRLIGLDVNNSQNWYSTANTKQNPNVNNNNIDTNGIAVPIGNFSWYHQGIPYSTNPDTLVGPFFNPGFYQYIADYDAGCGTYLDTVTVFVNITNNNCDQFGTFNISNINCTGTDINWTASPSNAGQVQIKYGLDSYRPGMPNHKDTIVSGNFRLEGLASDQRYTLWVRNICAPGDTSSWRSPISFYTSYGPRPTADFNTKQIKVAGQNYLILDALQSKLGDEFYWELNNGQSGSGIVDTIPLPTNGIWEVKLWVQNACGLDSLFQKIFVNIGLDENIEVLQNISLFPNPADDYLQVEIQSEVNSEFDLLLINSHGQIILEQNIYMKKEENVFKLNLEGYSSGLYFVVLRNKDGVWKRKVLVN